MFELSICAASENPDENLGTTAPRRGGFLRDVIVVDVLGFVFIVVVELEGFALTVVVVVVVVGGTAAVVVVDDTDAVVGVVGAAVGAGLLLVLLSFLLTKTMIVNTRTTMMTIVSTATAAISSLTGVDAISNVFGRVF